MGCDIRFGLSILIDPTFPKTVIRGLVVMCEIKAVFDERGADVGVVADTIASDPRIRQRKREQEKGRAESTRNGCWSEFSFK